jgi:hypothetical protein
MFFIFLIFSIHDLYFFLYIGKESDPVGVLIQFKKAILGHVINQKKNRKKKLFKKKSKEINLSLINMCGKSLRNGKKENFKQPFNSFFAAIFT